MDADERRIAEARARNLEYIRRLDEKETQREVDEYLKQHVGGASDAGAHSEPRRKAPGGAAVAGSSNLKNTSVYITGLTTYMACKQLEGVCAKIGKVRRVKFYQDERGGLKGDALVTFASHNMMLKAVDKLNHFEIKPGVLLTATEAHFGGSKGPTSQGEAHPKQESHSEPTATSDRLFTPETLQFAAPLDEGEAGQAESKSRVQKSQETSSQLDLPSRSVILSHVWDPLAPQDDATKFFTELEDDMRQECGKHGRVEHVHILPTGGVMIRYEALAAAIKCLQVMNGRWFDGRQVEARFDPSTPEEPEDDATKLDAFFASLG